MDIDGMIPMGPLIINIIVQLKSIGGGYSILIQPTESTATKPDLFDFRAAIFLVLDGYKLESVSGLCNVAKMYWPNEAFLLDHLRHNCMLHNNYEKIKTDFEMKCDNLFPEDMADSHKYKQSGNSVSVPIIRRFAEQIYRALKAVDSSE